MSRPNRAMAPALACIALLSMIAAAPAAAQSGGIEVRVDGRDGNPLAGARVTLDHEAGFVPASTERTDDDGLARFPVLRPGGGYRVLVEAPGSSPIRRAELRVRSNQTTRVRIATIESVEERVRVRAERDMIDLDSVESTTRFSDEFIGDMPVLGRSYQNILTRAAGVQDADGDGNPNVHGSRTRDFRAEVNGISNVDPLTGQWMSRINPNSIEEIEVITAGAGVEFGRAQGGFARIIQKQGSNEHEGALEAYWRSSRLDGRLSSDTGLPQVDSEWWQPSLHVSGPVVRDRLWYRLSNEWREIEQPVRTPAGTQITSFSAATHSDQLTWQVTPRSKLALLFQSDPRDVDNFGISFNTTAEASQRLARGGETWSLTWTAPVSSRLLVESRAAWQSLETGRFPMTIGSPNTCIPGDAALALSFCEDVDLNRRTGSYFRTEDDSRQRFTLKSQATLYAGRHWGAEHQLKFGLSIENERYFRELTQTANLRYQTIRPGIDTSGVIDTLVLEPFGQAFLQASVPSIDRVRAVGTSWSVYVEDQLKPRDDLTITAGVRIDREESRGEGRSPLAPSDELATFQRELDEFLEFGLPDEVNAVFIGQLVPRLFTAYESSREFREEVRTTLCDPLPVAERGTCEVRVAQFVNTQAIERAEVKRRPEDLTLANTNFSPSLSVAWSPGASGRTAIKLAVGRHYNTIPLLVPLQELEPGLTNILYRVELPSGVPELSSGFEPTVSVRQVNRGLRTPYQDELHLAIEREIAPETALRLAYTSRSFRDQIQDENINVATNDYGYCFFPVFRTQPVVVPSPDTGRQWYDPIAGEFYVDDDPGPGDGRVDDCVGRNVVLIDGSLGPRPDGVADLYVQNPLWGDVFDVGNNNRIDYDAFELTLTRRQYRNWELQGSYVWSEAIGDGEDFFQELGDDPSLRDDVRGYQSYDQRHVVKLNATASTPWGVRLGTAVTWQSGLPYSVLVESPTFDSIPPSLRFIRGPAGRPRQQYLDESGPLSRNSARNESYWNVDLKLTREFSVRRVSGQLSVEVFNALDDRTFVVYDPVREAGRQVNGVREGFERQGRQWQLGMRLAF